MNNLDNILSQKAKENEFKMAKFDKSKINNMILIGKKKKKMILYRNLTLSSCAVLVIVFLATFYLDTYTNTMVESNINAVAENKENNDTTFYINYDTDELKDISDVEVLKEDAQQIVIAKVDKIEGCTNYNQNTGNYTRINTLGNIKILQVLKGDIEVSSIVPFIRGGGTISYSEYQKGVIYGDRNKIQGTYEYVTERRKGDIEIEEGKTYLMFLYYDSINERYEIMAYQYGLREYNADTQMVLNNDTHTMQRLSELEL